MTGSRGVKEICATNVLTKMYNKILMKLFSLLIATTIKTSFSSLVNEPCTGRRTVLVIQFWKVFALCVLSHPFANDTTLRVI